MKGKPMSASMSRITICIILGISLVVGMGCTMPNGVRWPNDRSMAPADAHPARQIANQAEMVLTVHTEKDTYLIGEPVYLAVRLFNPRNTTFKVLGELEPSSDAIQIIITDPQGTQKRFIPLGFADYSEEAIVPLKAESTIGNIFPIFFGNQGWTFPEVGQYHVQAIYLHSGTDGDLNRMISEPLAVTIQSDSKKAGKFLLEPGPAAQEVGKFLLWQSGDHLVLGKERLTTLISKWPDSRLATYASFALGKSLSEPFSDYRKGQVRPPDCERAEDFLEQVKLAEITPYIHLQLKMAKTRCRIYAKDIPQASELLGTISQLEVRGPEYKGLRNRLQEYKEGLTRLRQQEN